MSRPTYSGPSLPKSLLDQFTDVKQKSSPGRAKHRGQPASRKDLRKQQRVEKRTRQSRPRTREQSDSSAKAPKYQDKPQAHERRKYVSGDELLQSVNRAGGSVGRAASSESNLDQEAQASATKLTQSVKNTRPQVKKRLAENVAEDDAEILALEKKLGLKSRKKLPATFEQDGLSSLLDDLPNQSDSSENGGNEQKSTGNADAAWLQRKRLKSQGGDVHMLDTEEQEKSEEDGEGSVFSNEDVDSEAHLQPLKSGIAGRSKSISKRENPYLPPMVEGGNDKKYILPSLRAPLSRESENDSRVQRQIQGLINRLSEASMVALVGQIEDIYQRNSRHLVTSTMIEKLLTLLSDPTGLNDTFMVLHAGFVAAIYRRSGQDFAAQLVERLVERFDQVYSAESLRSQREKQCLNLISFLSQLYIFKVISSQIMFDHIRDLLNSVDEFHTELLLKIIRLSGPQLRRDDPSSLKDIVNLLQKTIASVGEANLSVRTRFMVETIQDLKNNRMKTGATASAIVAEHTTRLKKTIATLKVASTSEPLRLGLADIRQKDKKGKWWLVGASWKGAGEGDIKSSNNKTLWDMHEKANHHEEQEDGTSSAELVVAARKLGMNTSVRRSIFISLMSATDFKDAETRLTKLRLNRNQGLEIPRVLLKCAASEDTYNPFYTLVSRHVCRQDKRFRMAFQFVLWEFLRQLEDPDDESLINKADADLRSGQIVNYARLYGELVADGDLNITVLKVVDFLYMTANTRTFIEVLFTTILRRSARKQASSTALATIFGPASEVEGMCTGLRLILVEDVAKSDLWQSDEERSAMRVKCKSIAETLAPSRVDM